MKLFPFPLFYLSSFLALFFFLSSFSLHPSGISSRDDNPPISKKITRQQQRLEKKYQRLQKRLKKSKTVKKRQAIKERLRVIKKQQDDPSNSITIIGFVFSLVAFLFFLTVFALLIVNLTTPIGFGLIISLLFLGIGSGIIGLILSIISFITGKKNPVQTTQKRLGLLGIIMSSIVLGIALVFAILLLI